MKPKPNANIYYIKLIYIIRVLHVIMRVFNFRRPDIIIHAGFKLKFKILIGLL